MPAAAIRFQRVQEMKAGDVAGALAAALYAATDRWYDPSARSFDYAGFAGSAEHRRLAGGIGALSSFECSALGVGHRIPFWLNVYNALVLHMVVARGVRRSVRSQSGFFTLPAVRVAGRTFSLDDIEHGMLRGNAARYRNLRPQMASDDGRLPLATLMCDERIHFAMYSACRSSPRLFSCIPADVNALLEDAAHAYLAGRVRVEEGGRVLRVPKIFQWYEEDFGGERGVRRFVVARIASERDLEALERTRGDFVLRYAAFDWRLNETCRLPGAQPRAVRSGGTIRSAASVAAVQAQYSIVNSQPGAS